MRYHLNHNKIILFAIPLLFVIYVGVQLFVPLHVNNLQVEVQIPEGANYKQAVSILAQNELIRDKNLFLLLGKIINADKKIKAGYYTFFYQMSPLKAFRTLLAGKIIEYEVTIVEGDSLYEIGKKLAAAKIMSENDFNRLKDDESLLEELEIYAPSFEGYLAPQTYRFPKGAQPSGVFKYMVNTQRESYPDDFKKLAEKRKMTENEIMTLASIIEREAATDSERPIISAVFYNRLRKGMPLQADPTAIYGIKNYSQKVTKNDLRKKTPYNTYVIKGLPPGPISSPGKKAIIAALKPADVKYLYFVSNRDGTHKFSTSLAEHNEAVRAYSGSRSSVKEEDKKIKG
ncbi:MAG: endolytic transglycosylase MltG [Nitrospiraceae bacterium]|nr:endolytic transglycosylase MltG [Nitrospiraceae bacterium]